MPVVAAAGALFVLSPKRSGDSPGPFDNVRTMGPGTLGLGFWGNAVLGVVGTVVVLAAVGWALATLLPSFRRLGSQLGRELLIGATVLVAGAGPYIVGGAPFAVRGIFDRNNLVPDLGSCLLVAALLVAAVGRWGRPAWVGTALVLGVLAAGNATDIADYRHAVDEGRTLERAIVADVDPAAGDVYVLPPLRGEHGVAGFILDADLPAALALHHGPVWRSVRMPPRPPTCADLLAHAGATGRPALVYDRIDRRLLPPPDPRACRRRPPP